ncbi:hypothetical protein H0H92_006236 [Tricholoma furcatifolium]|nr:hypothetical protein H0H92_006236 [Tricholoma furcatifolium]
MTKRQWTTPDQRALLDSLLPEFVEAQKSRTSSSNFYQKAYSVWEAKNPYTQPTDEQIDAAAAEAHQKAVDKARAANRPIPAENTSPEYRQGLRKALLATEKKNQEKRIFEWFHNHSRIATSGTNKRSILKLTPKQPLQPWQAFGKKFSGDLKDDLNAGYAAYVQNLPPSEKPKTKLAWSMTFLKDRLENASEEVKEEVEAYRRNGPIEEQNIEERNKGYQDAIDRLPRTLKVLRDSVVEQAGWSILILVGGPHGRMGRVSSTIVQGGTRPSDGKEFTDTMSTENFEEAFLKPWEEYLESVYPSEVCKDRMLNPWTAMDPGSPINVSSDDESDEELEQTSVLKPEKRSGQGRHKSAAATTPLNPPANPEFNEAGALDPSLTKVTPSEKRKGRAKPQVKTRKSGRNAAQILVESEVDVAPSSPTEPAPATSTEPNSMLSVASQATAVDDESINTQEPSAAPTQTQQSMESIPTELTTTPATPAEPNSTPPVASQATAMDGQSINAQEPSASPEKLTAIEAPEPATTPTILPVTLLTDVDGADSDSPEVLIGLVESLPDWARAAFAFFEKITVAETSKKSWKDMINGWVKFEVGANASGGVTSRGSSLPTEFRPEEIGWWMKRKRLFTNIPKICSTEYSISFDAWWRDIQPCWRSENIADGGTLTHTVPVGASWDKMALGGPSGMFLVIVALAFWALAADAAATQDAFDGAVSDVAWAFKAMMPSLSSPGKRVMEDTADDRATSKRCVKSSEMVGP